MPVRIVTKHMPVNRYKVTRKHSVCAWYQKLARVRETTHFANPGIGEELQIIGKMLACFMHLKVHVEATRNQDCCLE